MISFKEQQLQMLNQLGDVFSFSYDLQKINFLAKKKPKEMVKCAENFYKWQIDEIANNFVAKKAKIIFVAGGSSAGKTTSAFNIRDALKKLGKVAHVISMDDFFVNREDTPKAKDGSYDFENITALDIPYFTSFLKDILAGKVANLPFYDFVSGTRSELTPMKLEKNEVLIIEGLHALNPIFFKDIPKKSFYKVYVSVISNFTLGNELVIDSKEIRFMRRLLRDYYKRGKSVNSTIEMWRKVSVGEEKFILPYRADADYLLNTTHMYEPLLYDKFLEPIVKHYDGIKEIDAVKKTFSKTGKFDEKFIPKQSLIREFMPVKN